MTESCKLFMQYNKKKHESFIKYSASNYTRFPLRDLQAKYLTKVTTDLLLIFSGVNQPNLHGQLFRYIRIIVLLGYNGP